MSTNPHIAAPLEPRTAREVAVARSAYIIGRQHERQDWRDGRRLIQGDDHAAVARYPAVAGGADLTCERAFEQRTGFLVPASEPGGMSPEAWRWHEDRLAAWAIWRAAWAAAREVG